MKQFVVEVRLLVSVNAHSADAAERIAEAKVTAALASQSDATVAGAHAVDPDAATLS